jgi:hypothetical protein
MHTLRTEIRRNRVACGSVSLPSATPACVADVASTFFFFSFALELRTKDFLLLLLLGLRLLCFRSQIFRSGRVLSSTGCRIRNESTKVYNTFLFCTAIIFCATCVCVCVVPSLPGHRSDRTGANSPYQTWTGAELLSVLLRNPELTRPGLYSS